MPKMKTRRATTKRFKLTGTGKLMHKPTGMSHLRSGKSSRRKRRLSGDAELAGGYKRQMMRCLPYVGR